MIRKVAIVMLTLGAVGTGALWTMSYLHWPGVWWYDGTVGPYGYRFGHSVPPLEGPTWVPYWFLLASKKSEGAVQLTVSSGSVLADGMMQIELPPGTRPPPNKRLRLLGFELQRSRWAAGGTPFAAVPPEHLAPPRHGIEYNIRIPLWAPSLLFAAYPAIAFIRGPVRRWRRRRKGLCVKCGYDLTGNVSGACPECGGPIGRSPKRA